MISNKKLKERNLHKRRDHKDSCCEGVNKNPVGWLHIYVMKAFFTGSQEASPVQLDFTYNNQR